MAGTLSRKAHRGNVDPTTGTRYGKKSHNNRKNKTGGRRYQFQGVLPPRPKRLKNESDDAYKRRIREWKRTVKPIKFICHDKWA
jgi:hypothetical protein